MRGYFGWNYAGRRGKHIFEADDGAIIYRGALKIL
jgi:hypothetical protein